MKILQLIGLIFLVSCGQTLDTTEFSDKDGETHDTGTNYNKIQDIQDCLNGDQEACERAVAEGFTNAPIFFSTLKNKNTLELAGKIYRKSFSTDDMIRFQRTKRFWNWNGNYHVDMIEDVEVHSDYSIDVRLFWKYHHQTNYEEVYKIINNHAFDTIFHLDPAVELEWKSYDSKTIHIETYGNIKVK